MFDDGSWKTGPVRFSGSASRVPASCSTGITRDLQPVCEPLETLALDGCILLANALPFARYDPKRDMWDGLMRQSSWHAFRIVVPELLGSHARTEADGRAMPA